jgi:hypothetical protein
MPETPLDTSTWPRARRAARDLRIALAGLGLDENVIRGIVPRGDLSDGEHVRLGTWPVEAIEKLLARLRAGAGVS